MSVCVRQSIFSLCKFEVASLYWEKQVDSKHASKY